MTKKYLLLFYLVGISFFSFSDPVKTILSKAGKSLQFPGAGYVVLFDSTRVEMKESGLSYYHEHKLIKILNSEGAKHFNVFKYDYDPLSAYVDIKKIHIWYKDGREKVLNSKDECNYPAPAGTILWGAHQKMIEMGRLEAGDAFEVFVEKKGFTYALLQPPGDDDNYIPPMKGHFYDIVPFWSDVPVLSKVYQVYIPDSKKVQYQVYNGSLTVSEKKVPGKMCYTFSLSDIMPLAPEPSMVALSDVAPKLLISTSPDWQTKSRWFYQVNEDYESFNSTPEIDKKVKAILKGAKSEEDSVSRLTHWVADELRYLGLSMGKGEGFTLHKGSIDFRDRCGVCKDKAGMLVTMLRSAGFEAYAAMTMAGSKIDRIPADQFNHSVSLVKLSDGKLHLLDPTWVPFVRELWSSAEQQQNYLPGIPEGSDLLETPVSPPENHYIKISANSTLSKDGTLTGEITVTAEGQSDASLRRMFTGAYKSLWAQNMENELLKICPKAKITSASFGSDPYQYMNGPINLKFVYAIPDYATITPHEIIFTPLAASGIFAGAMKHLSIDLSPETRKYPFRDGCSKSVEITDRTILPETCKLNWVPQIEQIEGSGATFNGIYSLRGNELSVLETAKFKKRVYAPEDWPSFRNSVKMQKMMAENPIILTF